MSRDIILDEKPAKPIVVLGAWSSGTSALAGVMNNLGFYTCPPHFQTNDPRTPNSFESISLKEIIARHFNEPRLERIPGDPDVVSQDIRIWYEHELTECLRLGKRGVVIKLPSLCFFVPELCRALQPDFIVMTRPLALVEKTRQRRGWHAQLGQAGALKCTQAMIPALIELQRSFISVSFGSLLATPESELRRLLSFVDSEISNVEIQSACEFLVRR